MAQQTDNSESYTSFQLRCEPEFKENLRVAAAKRGKSMSEHVRDTLRETWNSTTSTNKGIDTSGNPPTPSGDYEVPENSQTPDNNEGVYNDD